MLATPFNRRWIDIDAHSAGTVIKEIANTAPHIQYASIHMVAQLWIKPVPAVPEAQSAALPEIFKVFFIRCH
jgi:hypothetical protein